MDPSEDTPLKHRCTADHDHSHHNHDHHTHDHPIERTESEVKSFQQMDKPKFHVERYINIYLLLQLPLYYVMKLFLDEWTRDERMEKLQTKVDKMLSPLDKRVLLGNIFRILILNLCDILVVLYLFKPLSKLTKQETSKLQNGRRELQKLAKQPTRTQEDKTKMLSLRNTLSKTITRKRQKYNNIVSEYVYFCFIMNTIVSWGVFGLNILSYYVLREINLSTVSYFAENTLIGALYLRMLFFVSSRYDSEKNSKWRKILISLFLGVYIFGKLFETAQIGMIVQGYKTILCSTSVSFGIYYGAKFLNDTRLFIGIRRIIYTLFMKLR